MIALPSATAVPAISPAIAVELLLVRPAAVLCSVAALVAVVVSVVAMIARALVVLAEFALGPLLLLLPRFGRGFSGGGGRRRGRRSRLGCVLGYDGSHGWRRGVDRVTSIYWSLRGSIEVRIRLASGISGRTAVRARATATTMRASAFGHATMFIMGCLLAMSRRYRRELAVLLWIKSRT